MRAMRGCELCLRLGKYEMIFTFFLLLFLSASLFVVFLSVHIFTFARRHKQKE